MATDSGDKVPTKADLDPERIDVDEILATSERLIDKMKTLIENAQKVINRNSAPVSRRSQQADSASCSTPLSADQVDDDQHKGDCGEHLDKTN